MNPPDLVLDWHPRTTDASGHPYVLGFSPAYKPGDYMRFRVIAGQFVKSCDEITWWAPLAERVEPEDEYTGGDAIIKLPGSTASFRCHCGGNVFSKHKTDPLKYRCNSCHLLLEGEK